MGHPLLTYTWNSDMYILTSKQINPPLELENECVIDVVIVTFLSNLREQQNWVSLH